MSYASNLVASDTNNTSDIFVRGLQTGTTERVSVSSSGEQANGRSTASLRGTYGPPISADGRNVAFVSSATNLVESDTNDTEDVFVCDLQTGTTELVSVNSSGEQANGFSDRLSISSDGRFVAFQSRASNLVPNDTNRWNDVFVHDRQTGATELVSVNTSEEQTNGDSYRSSISSDGRFVAFESKASNLVANDTNGEFDVFVRDRQTGTTERVSVNSSGEQTISSSRFPSISSDGRFIAFNSYGASNLVPNETFVKDVFVHDRQTGTTEIVSIDDSGKKGRASSKRASISSDGRFVAFDSRAGNLVPNDTNTTRDIFVHDRQRETTQRVNVDSSGNEANRFSRVPSISSDGSLVAFESLATNLVPNDTNLWYDVFVHERDTTAPKVRRVLPTDGVTDTALKTNVVATFSERMEKSSLNRATFELYELTKNPDGTTSARQIADATVTPSSDGIKATLKPYGTSERLLAANTRYKAVVSEGAMDIFGNPLDQNPSLSGKQPKVWYFETRN